MFWWFCGYLGFSGGSDNEVEFKVLESVADVDAAEPARALFVVELVSRPLQGPDVDIACPALYHPCSLRLVYLGALQESWVERCGGRVQGFLLFNVLHVSEVCVAVKVAGFGLLEAAESLVPPDLVL